MKMALHKKGAMTKANVTSIVWLVGSADGRGVVVIAVVFDGVLHQPAVVVLLALDAVPW